MKRLSLPLLSLLVVAACSAAPDTIKAAKEYAKDRDFTVLSESASNSDPFSGEWADVEVSFGEGGCTGVIRFQDGKGSLTIDLPIPGSPTETTQKKVDHPTVDRLRENTAFQHCFAPRTPQPTT